MVPRSDNDLSEDYGAILLWLPPGKQGGSAFEELPLLYRSGFLKLTLPWHYGPGAVHRIDSVYEANVHSMFDATLKPRGIKEKECGFVQMLAVNPKRAGKGYASKLLQWRIDKHFEEFPDRPVILDTSTEQGVRTYERMGFELLDQKSVETNTDADGIRLSKGASDIEKEEARKICVQRVMLKMPPN
jgi:GNAT superfamily N-acetyltransferase